SWNHWQEILEHVELAVAKRPGSSYNTPAALAAELQKQHKTLHQLSFSPIDISASHIRHILALQQDPSDFLDPAVAHYIQAEGLYRQAANSTDTDL
ncbi:MAG: nicotinate-nicotinamide nucleotide adenylyltransferase, partial [Paenalcaligenes sp.]